MLGPVRRGGTVRPPRPLLARGGRSARFEAAGATMLFGVPTMYRRLADAAERVAGLAGRSRGARLLVSGSAALPAAEHARLQRPDRPRRRRALRDDRDADEHRRSAPTASPRRARSGRRWRAWRCGSSTTTARRSTAPTTRRSARSRSAGPNLFLGYLNRPDATAEAMRDGWFATGDMATRDAARLHPDRRPPRDRPDQERRLQDRRRRDRGRAARAPRGRRTPRSPASPTTISASGSSRGSCCATARDAGERELIDHVAAQLAPHKRPRVVRFLDELPRNELGKVVKQRLGRHRGLAG